MLIPTIVMGVIALIFYIITARQGEGQHINGLKSAMQMTLEILPILLFAFIIAGLVQTILPQDLLSRWVGTESGFRGIIVGTLAGSITPGGPYVSLPVVAGLLRSGAGVGTMVAYLTAWSLWAIARLPMEFGILGWRFTLIRILSVLIFPPIAGVIANGIGKFFNI